MVEMLFKTFSPITGHMMKILNFPYELFYRFHIAVDKVVCEPDFKLIKKYMGHPSYSKVVCLFVIYLLSSRDGG